MHLRRTLWFDAAIEAVVALALLILASRAAEWMAVSTTITLVAGAIFVLAAVAIAVIARQPSPHAGLVRALAIGNIVAASVAWLVVVLAWSALAAEGRWLIGAAADAFILVGLLELRALSRARVDG